MNAPTADFDDALLAQGLPALARCCIERAAQLRGAHPQRARRLLDKALRLAPDHPAPLIALYRHCFYAHQLREARACAERAMQLGARHLQLPEAWCGTPAQALPGARFDAMTRFYLFSLKGHAYLSLRLGELGDARCALQLLTVLDPHNHVGGALLSEVLCRHGRDGDEDLESAA